MHCQLVTPKFTAGKKLKGMLQFHGYHGDSGDFQDKIGWVAEGFVVLAMDARGQGGLSEDCTKTKGGVLKGLIIRGLEEGKENLYYRQVFLRIPPMQHASSNHWILWMKPGSMRKALHKAAV